ncbi:MAG: nucleotidyltransferase family protein, partial [Hyphomicrobiaceae bacterium]
MFQDHVTDWLLWCADPIGSRREPPIKALSASEFETFIKRAASHGILGWVIKNAPTIRDDGSLSATRSKAETTFRIAQLLSFKLRSVAAQLTAPFDNQAVALVKGPVFADKLYPDPTRRTFTDLDYLVAPSALEVVSSALNAQCFAAYDDPDQETRQEWFWLHRRDPDLMIEVHTNLIHSSRMRKRLQLGLDQISQNDGRPDSPACLLFIAICHGAVSDQFKRIRQLVDICQAAR